MSLSIDFIILFFSLIFLILAASKMVDSAIFISKIISIPKSIIGATIIAYGTSSPEILVSLQATLNNETGIAIGNVVGSNIANVCVGMGLICFFGKKDKLEIRPLYSTSLFFLVLATLYAMIATYNNYVSHTEGLVLIGILVSVNVLLIKQAKNDDGRENKNNTMQVYGLKTSSLMIGILVLVLSIIGLILSASQVVFSSIAIAAAMDIEASFIGFSIIAVGTSLPEIIVSLTAIKKGEPSIAIGNIIGSNTFNILGVIGIPALINGMVINIDDMNTQLIFLFISTIFVLSPFIIKSTNKFLGSILIIFYIFSLYFFAMSS